MANKTVMHVNQMGLFYQPKGKYTSFSILRVGETGVGDKTKPGTGITPVYVADENGNPRVLTITREAPGGLPNTNVTFYSNGKVPYFEKKRNSGERFDMQVRYNPCTLVNNPNGWTFLWHWARTYVTQRTQTGGPMMEYSGQTVSGGADVISEYVLEVERPELVAIANSLTADFDGLAVLSDPTLNEENGYPGPDQIMFFGGALSGANPPVYYTLDGGEIITKITNDPFSATDEEVAHFVLRFIDCDQLRLGVCRSATVALEKAKIAYLTDYPTTELTAATWTEVELTDTSNGDYVTASNWSNPNLAFVAVTGTVEKGDIYLSTDYLESFETTPVYSGSNQINQIKQGSENTTVWVVGNSNLILKAEDNTALFTTVGGPDVAGDCTAIAEANNGALYVANGTILYRSVRGGGTGSYTSLKDFGASHVIREIDLGGYTVGGDPQIIRLSVFDGTDSSVWMSVDGGNTFFEVPNLTNEGYNKFVWSNLDVNLGFGVGDAVTAGNSVLHKYQGMN